MPEILQIRSEQRLLENFTLSTKEDPLREIQSRLWLLMRILRAIEPRHFWRYASSFLAQENVIRVKVGLLHDEPPGASSFRLCRSSRRHAVDETEK